MSDIKYYKTNHPSVLEVFSKLKADRESLVVAGQKFASAFGGALIMARSSNEFYVCDGLVFDPIKVDPFWTKPNKKMNNAQKPRALSARLNGKTELIRLNKLWFENYPSTRVSANPLYEVMGTDWGHVMFSGLGWMHCGDYFYVTTPLALNELMVEITVTEFRAAEKVLKSAVPNE